MNQEKIGKFIADLRKNKNLTQEQLAEQLNIGREAVSKWERGKTLPDYNVLKDLSNFFNISVDEILAGEKHPTESIALELYKERFKLKRKIFYTVIVCFLLVILFLGYYFFNQFKSVNIYIISGENNNFELSNGLLVKTNENIYFNLNINSKLDHTIDSMELYSLLNGEKQFITESNDNNLFFIDYNGYNEYWNFSTNDQILKNLYVKINYKIKDQQYKEEIHLNLVKEYVNDNFFNIKEKNIGDVSLQNLESNSDISFNKINKDSLLEKINMSFKKQDDGYVFLQQKNKLNYTYIYFPDDQNIFLSITDNQKLIEEYSYYLNQDTMTYTKYDNNAEILFSFTYENNNYNCDIGDCVDLSIITNKFINNLLTI